ncbi:hypothetical protein KDK95_16540 [Actinospica sp. MGRD01-02]|uniref:Uncharacterized protein n=1 Tax=Actinospica acidithermotolerans TaxID=2828514 RepID=A0A941EB11_9ACTN|nr:hypothetical protein [Actinospica acidithermotolerans]MBR7827927.1 hypothetical protein [Actinospica acidithermotolerans]
MARAESEDPRDRASRADRGWPPHSFVAVTQVPVLADLLDTARAIPFAPGEILMHEGTPPRASFSCSPRTSR